MYGSDVEEFRILHKGVCPIHHPISFFKRRSISCLEFVCVCVCIFLSFGRVFASAPCCFWCGIYCSVKTKHLCNICLCLHSILCQEILELLYLTFAWSGVPNCRRRNCRDLGFCCSSSLEIASLRWERAGVLV